MQGPSLYLPFPPCSFSFLFFSFLATLLGTQDLCSLTGIEPVPPAVKAWSPHHWTAREFPPCCFFECFLYLFYSPQKVPATPAFFILLMVDTLDLKFARTAWNNFPADVCKDSLVHLFQVSAQKLPSQ